MSITSNDRRPQLPPTLASPLARWYNRLIKRTFDITAATTLLLTVFPIAYLVVAIVVKATDGGPVMEREPMRTLDAATLYHRSRPLLRFRLADNGFVRITHLDRWPRVINVLCGTATFFAPKQTPADVYRYLTRWSPLTDIAQAHT